VEETVAPEEPLHLSGKGVKKIAAQAWLDGVTASLVRGDYVEPKQAKLTVGEWGEKWLAGRVDVKPKRLAGYESLWRCVEPTWQRVPLCAVSHSDVVEWLAKLHAAELSTSRMRQAHSLLSSMLDAAVKDKRLAANPAAGATPPAPPALGPSVPDPR